MREALDLLPAGPGHVLIDATSRWAEPPPTVVLDVKDVGGSELVAALRREAFACRSEVARTGRIRCRRHPLDPRRELGRCHRTGAGVLEAWQLRRVRRASRRLPRRSVAVVGGTARTGARRPERRSPRSRLAAQRTFTTMGPLRRQRDHLRLVDPQNDPGGRRTGTGSGAASRGRRGSGQVQAVGDEADGELQRTFVQRPPVRGFFRRSSRWNGSLCSTHDTSAGVAHEASSDSLGSASCGRRPTMATA